MIVKVLQERSDMPLQLGTQNVAKNMNEKGTQFVIGLKKPRFREATQTPVTYTQQSPTQCG